ncbi:MAG TPA: ATP-binding protein [Pseudolabrys sp.]|nr:ATP-binding protein [Pseudolabrys sp.]
MPLQMKRLHSISFRLSTILISFFLLVIALSLFSVSRLNDFNGVSTNITDVWLPNTRLLGDLNNYTSDYRAAEASALLAMNPADLELAEAEMRELNNSVTQAQRGYERSVRDPVERALYDEFKRDWDDYQQIVDRVLALVHAGKKTEANALYAGTSRIAYAAVSDTLGQLTNHNVVNAQQASGLVGEAYEQARWMIRIGMLLAAAMIAAAVLYVRRSISTPLLELANGMRRLAANDTNVEFRGTGRGDEIGAMTNAAVVFRKNAVELMLNQRALEQEASMLEEKLAHEQRLTRLQRNFISMVSHEFRTPLTIIDGHARRLIKVKDAVKPEDIAERSGKIRTAVTRLTHLIDNLLNSSRLLDSGVELYFHPTEIDPAALLHELCQLHREIAPDAEIVEEFDALPAAMTADAKLLFQALSNLISNAIKYSPDGGAIKVSASAKAGQIVIAVEDHGIGIPEQDVSQLFTRYFRASNVSGITGTGIGLYLVRMVVELHGGSIGVDSRETRGSTFTVKLPLRAPSQAKDDAPAAVAKTHQSTEV